MLNAEKVSSEWTEDSVTFSSGIVGAGTVVSVPLVTTGQTVKVNITDMVKAALEQGEQEISLRLYSSIRGADKYATFYSKESTEQAPILRSSRY